MCKESDAITRLVKSIKLTKLFTIKNEVDKFEAIISSVEG